MPTNTRKGNPLRVITIEEHFHHPAVVARVERLSGAGPTASADTAFPNRTPLDLDAAERLDGRRLEHMDRAGIDVQVVSHGPSTPSALDHPDAVDLCRRVNDTLAEKISEHPDRFKGFATIPLCRPDAAADELRRCVTDLGFVGTLTMGAPGGRFLDDERFEPVLAAAAEIDLPIYLHPGIPSHKVTEHYYTGNWPAAMQFLFSTGAFGWHADAGIQVVRLILSGALDRHPYLKLISGHWGELMAFWLDRLDSTFRYTDHLARPFSDYYRTQVWMTPAGIYNQHKLEYVVAELGADRVIHSEDFPYVSRDDVSTFLHDADLTDDQRHAIAHRNAENLLRI